MHKSKIRCVLIDDEIRALNRLKILLKNFPEVDILEQYTDAQQGINYIEASNPDLVFLDIEMPGKTGLEIADEIRKSILDTKIIFVTSHNHYAINAIKNEAFDYLLKPVSIDDLKEAIERFNTRVKLNLTKRELEIIHLIAKGHNSKEIGKKLFISNHTVDTYRRTILEKTKCKNAAELIMYASKKNLV